MDRTKLTSAGILLILAIAAAGGIFLLDLLYLQPRALDQEKATLRDVQAQAEQSTALLLDSEAEALHHVADAWASTDDSGQLLQDSPNAVAYVKDRLSTSPATLLVVCDSSDRAIRAWKREGKEISKLPQAELASLQEMLDVVRAKDPALCVGVLKLPSGLMLFAQHDLWKSPQQERSPGRLWMLRDANERLLSRVAAAIGGQFMFVAAGQLPDSELPQDEKHSVWSSEERLCLAWPVTDSTGRRVGYWRADLQKSEVYQQSTAGRRTALIVMSLSVGLSLLVIVGAHMLITGPVVRLLKRLHRLESGHGSARELSRDLHGEPLLLARKLESAFDRLAHMSKTDQLTGLANRRHFEQVLDCFYNQARRYNRPLSLTMIDVDFFKAINDTGGHQAGDEVLKKVAAAVEKSCRKADLPARFGGDEFAILLPETAAGDAQSVVARVAAAVAELRIHVHSLGVSITLSAGVADLNSGEIGSPEAMMALADKALYAAKETGRNRIVQAHDLTGLNWRSCGETSDKVDKMCRKLAGLDNKVKDLFLQAIEEMVVILEHRNPDMADHAHKVQHYAMTIGREMELPERVLNRIQIAAMLQDIGMIAMPDSVLLNSGPLDEEQMKIVRRHPLLSVRIMEGMEFLEQEIPAVRYHHERFDGSGYPEGISGASVPLTARILSLADAFDSMTSSRCYRQAMTYDQAVAEIKAQSGKQFDPTIVDAFLAAASRLGRKLMEIPPRRRAAILDEAPLADSRQVDEPLPAAAK